VGEYAADIHTSGQHLLDLINDILDMSKIEAGMLEMNEEVLSFREIAEDCIRLMRQRASDHGVDLTSDGIEGAVPINADRRRIKQLLLNLMSNAIKFTPAGGTVSLRYDIDASGGLCFAIRDTGIGMSPEDLAKALQPFSQIDNDLTRQHDGTGLGLPICKALAELHQGVMTLESAEGEGTTVTISLPAARMAQDDGGATGDADDAIGMIAAAAARG
jgi:signal transduction histidine kinase